MPSDGPPPPSSEHVARRMRRQRRTATGPEVLLRRELHRRGLRYRVNVPVLPDGRRHRADIVFTRARVVAFVDGCFWHACPEHGTLPKSNREWWRTKLDRNVERDRDTDMRLRAAGWTVLRFWEHQEVLAAANTVEAAVRRSSRAR